MPIDMLPAYFASPLLFAVMVIQLFLSLFSRYHLWKAAISCSFACFSFPKSRFSKGVPLISSLVPGWHGDAQISGQLSSCQTAAAEYVKISTYAIAP